MEERRFGAGWERWGLRRVTDFCVSSCRHLLAAVPSSSSNSNILQVFLPDLPWILSSAPLFPASLTSGFPLSISLHTLSTPLAYFFKI